MPLASLDIVIPDRYWIGEISRRYPHTRFRIHSMITADDGGTAMVQLLGIDVPSLIIEFSEYESVPALTVLNQRSDEAVLELRTRTSVLLEAFSRANVSIPFPFTIVDGVATLEILTSSNGLSRFRKSLTSLKIDFTVNHVHEHVEVGGSLTDRQLHLVRGAVDHGYYDTPRQCTLTELAGELDFAVSTVSTTLHRAEETIVKQFLQQTIIGHQSPGNND